MALNGRRMRRWRASEKEGRQRARGPRPAPGRALPASAGKRLAGQGATEGSDAAHALLLNVRCPDMKPLYRLKHLAFFKTRIPAAISGG